MDHPLPEQSETTDDILVTEETKSEASIDPGGTHDQNSEGGAVGGAKDQDDQLDQNNAKRMTQQADNNEGDSQLTSDEGKVMEGAVGGDTVSCDQCETETAIMYCQNCPGYLCKICHGVHKKSRLTRFHSYINISPHMLSASLYVQNDKNENKEGCKIKCSAHPAKLAGSICKTCAFPICSDCEPNHKEHDSVDLKQENIRQLQFICTDDSQLLLKLIAKLEALQKIKSSEGLYADAIKCMALAKQKFENLIKSGGKHSLVVESLRKEKPDVVEKHNKKLENIANTLDEAIFVLSKVQFAGTTTDINIVLEALHYFYEHYNSLITKHATLLAQKYKQPDTVQLENIKAQLSSIQNTFHCYKDPCTKYDTLKQSFYHSFRTILDFIAISPSMFMWASDSFIGYYDTVSMKICKEKRVEQVVFRLGFVTNTRIFGLGSISYIIYDENLKQISSYTKKTNHQAFASWDSNNILLLDCDNKSCKVFLLKVSTQPTMMLNTQMGQLQSTLLFNTTEITEVDGSDILFVSSNACKEIIIIVQQSSKLYKFDQTGKLILSVHLPLKFESVISSFFVDEDDNLVVGCTNGGVYFLDYKTNKRKLLLTLWGPVMRIDKIENLLYANVCFSKPGEGASQSTLYVYEIVACDDSIQ